MEVDENKQDDQPQQPLGGDGSNRESCTETCTGPCKQGCSCNETLPIRDVRLTASESGSNLGSDSGLSIADLEAVQEKLDKAGVSIRYVGELVELVDSDDNKLFSGELYKAAGYIECFLSFLIEIKNKTIMVDDNGEWDRSELPTIRQLHSQQGAVCFVADLAENKVILDAKTCKLRKA